MTIYKLFIIEKTQTIIKNLLIFYTQLKLKIRLSLVDSLKYAFVIKFINE